MTTVDTGSEESFDLASTCKKAVKHLSELNINFLALDFDQTIIDIHTGGVWKGSVQELADRVRPMFRHIITAAHEANIKISVVTFSPQVNHISDVLSIIFPMFSHEILIRGRDGSWFYEGNGMRDGKQPYMASAAEEFQTKYDLDITKNTTLFIDDDSNNIRLALKDGVRAIRLRPSNSKALLDNILRLP